MLTPLLILALLLSTQHNLIPTSSVQSSPHPYRLTLPDSTQSPPIHLIGSPGFSLTVDTRGYTVLVDPKDGYVKYAARNQDGELIPTEFKMLMDESLDPGMVYNLTKYVEPAGEVKERECGRYCVDERERYEWRGDISSDGGCDMFCLEGGIFTSSESNLEKRRLHKDGGQRDDVDEETVIEGTKNTNFNSRPSMKQHSKKTTSRKLLRSTQNNKLINLVIPIKFANHRSRPTIVKSHLSTLFNSPQPVDGIAPTGSIREYFAINSYGKLIVETTVVDWIHVKNTEQYYAGKKSGLDNTFHESLVEALDKLDKDPNFTFQDYDGDGDGVVDSIFFVHSGYSAEWGGVDCINGNDRSNRIWSHKWNIGGNGNHGEMGWMSKDGVRVNDYAVSSAVYGVCGKSIARIGTIAHEMGRLFGLPSLYGGDAPHGGNGIGSFGLMGNSWGEDGEQYKPPLLSPWSKIELGWLEPVTISSSGKYSLPPFASNPKVFRIELGREDEFLLLENRLAGLVVWHIDNRAKHYPSENLINSDSLGSHAHYRVSLISAEGTFDLEQGVNRGDIDDVFRSNHTIGPGFTGEKTSYPNTDSYREGVVTPSGIQITSISNVQDDLDDGHIEFTVLFPGEIIPDITAQPSPEPTTKVSNSPSIRKSLLSTFGSNTGSTGIMFDLVGLKPVEITSLDLHLRSDADDGKKLIEVYAMSGSHLGNENSTELWSKICCSKKVIGNGVSKRTILDATYFFRKLPVASGEKIALYVTSDEPIVRYSSSSKECCEVYTSSLDLQILEGSGVGSHPFGPTVKSRVFNGAIHYDTKQNVDLNDSHGEPPSRYPTDLLKSATSTYFNGNSGAHGIMFDVIPKKEMIATGLSFHTNLVDDIEVNVWVREGTYVGYERDQLAWKHVCDHASVKCQGSLRPTSITQGFEDFKLNIFERTAIYITLSTPNLRYTKLDEVSAGIIAYDLPDISIFTGSGIKGFPFGVPISPRLWNGVIQYALLDDEYKETKLSVKAPSNSSSVSDTNVLSTTFASGNRGYGCMFDISNTEGNYARITSLDFHTNLMSDINVIVYTKIRTFIGSEFKPSDWSTIVNTTVTGQGYYKRTPIPTSDFTQISIPNGAIQGFYLTLDKPNLLYSNVEENVRLGDLMYQSKGVRFHVGNGLQGHFSSVYQPRVFNGAIHFYQNSDEPYEEPASMEPTNYQFETALNGDVASFGAMFSVRNKHSNPIYIASFSFHTDIETDCAVELYTIQATYLGREQSPSEWTKLLGTQSKCAGANKWTVLPTTTMQPVEILAGKQQSFYITLETPSLKLSTNIDSEVREDKYIEVLNGSSVAGYPFGLNISPREPVISIGYEIEPNF